MITGFRGGTHRQNLRKNVLSSTVRNTMQRQRTWMKRHGPSRGCHSSLSHWAGVNCSNVLLTWISGEHILEINVISITRFHGKNICVCVCGRGGVGGPQILRCSFQCLYETVSTVKKLEHLVKTYFSNNVRLAAYPNPLVCFSIKIPNGMHSCPDTCRICAKTFSCSWEILSCQIKST